ncbi:unnamed protein product [Gadus morhua 'NCC']
MSPNKQLQAKQLHRFMHTWEKPPSSRQLALSSTGAPPRFDSLHLPELHAITRTTTRATDLVLMDTSKRGSYLQVFDGLFCDQLLLLVPLHTAITLLQMMLIMACSERPAFFHLLRV